MKAFAVDQYKPIADLSHLKQVDLPMPDKPQGHDLIVQVKAVATNPIDYKRLANLGKHQQPFELKHPLVVGWDATGIVQQIGPDVTLFKPGDEVMFAGDFFRPGAFAQYTKVDERITALKPNNLSWSEAAALPLTSLTAWEALVDRLHISTNKDDNKDKTILITAAAGGVGSTATQIAKKVLGLTVIATASRPETTHYAKRRGADHVVSHKEQYKPQLKAIDIENVDYILHCSDLTPELFTEFTDIVKPFGSIASIWPSATVDLMQLFWKSINFSTELMFTRPNTGVTIQRQHHILTNISQLVEEGVLESTETETFDLTLENLRGALEKQATGKAIGKITLTFSD